MIFDYLSLRWAQVAVGMGPNQSGLIRGVSLFQWLLSMHKTRLGPHAMSITVDVLIPVVSTRHGYTVVWIDNGEYLELICIFMVCHIHLTHPFVTLANTQNWTEEECIRQGGEYYRTVYPAHEGLWTHNRCEHPSNFVFLCRTNFLVCDRLQRGQTVAINSLRQNFTQSANEFGRVYEVCGLVFYTKKLQHPVLLP